jgi:Subtilase family
MRTALRITIVIALASITIGVGAAAGSTTPRPRARVDLAVAEQATVQRSDDRIAWYSSRGPTWCDAHFKPDFVAPGHGIVAAAAKNSTGLGPV